MAGTPKAFQSDAFQNDAFQTGEAGAETAVRLLTMLGVGFEWLVCLGWWLNG